LLQIIRTNNPKTQIVAANIPNVCDIPFVNTLDLIFRPAEWLGITDPVPVIFDETFQPVDFDPTPTTKYMPLVTEEQNVDHLLLPAISFYQQGIGVPDSAAMVAMGIPSITASFFVLNMINSGLNPTGIPIAATMSLTSIESSTIKTAVDGYNVYLSSLGIPIVDINSGMSDLNNGDMPGFSGKFVYLAPTNTAFSLDGIHANNAGYAIIANEYIKVINQSFQLSIPLLNVENYLGQYVGTNIAQVAPGAFDQVIEIFSN
jgi:hypothetical protein